MSKDTIMCMIEDEWKKKTKKGEQEPNIWLPATEKQLVRSEGIFAHAS